MPQSLDDRTAPRPLDAIDGASRTRRVSVVVLYWLLCVTLLYLHLISIPPRFVHGQMVTVNILAPIEYNNEDKEKLTQLPGLSSDEIIAVVNPDFAEQALRRLTDFRRDIDNIRRATEQLELSNPRAQELMADTADRFQLEPQ